MNSTKNYLLKYHNDKSLKSIAVEMKYRIVGFAVEMQCQLIAF